MVYCALGIFSSDPAEPHLIVPVASQGPPVSTQPCVIETCETAMTICTDNSLSATTFEVSIEKVRATIMH